MYELRVWKVLNPWSGQGLSKYLQPRRTLMRLELERELRRVRREVKSKKGATSVWP